MQLSLFENNMPLKMNKFLSLASKIGCDTSLSGWPDVFGKKFFQKFGAEQRINTLSIFSGAGGLDIGFHDMGFDIVERVEIEPAFCKTLRANTGHGRYFLTGKTLECDIRSYSPNIQTNIDFIIGGPPCQSFSAAGRRANGVSGICDERGVLFKEYIRLLDQLKPHGFIFENVYGITGAQQGKAWEQIKNSFIEAGYKIFYRILDAADYGVPQHRERLFIVGVRSGHFYFPKPTHGPDSINNSDFYNAGTAISSIPQINGSEYKHICGRFGQLLDDIPPGLNYSFYTEEMGHPQPIFAWRSKFSDFMYKADPEAPVRTIKAQGGQYTGPFHWTCRHFTISEYKRLQTFPDEYMLLGNNSEKIRQIGNSVPPQLARILALAIRNQLFLHSSQYDIDYLRDDEELGFRKRKRLLTQIYREKAQKAIRSLIVSKSVFLKNDDHFFVNITKDFKVAKVAEKNHYFILKNLLQTISH